MPPPPPKPPRMYRQSVICAKSAAHEVSERDEVIGVSGPAEATVAVPAVALVAAVAKVAVVARGTVAAVVPVDVALAAPQGLAPEVEAPAVRAGRESRPSKTSNMTPARTTGGN